MTFDFILIFCATLLFMRYIVATVIFLTAIFVGLGVFARQNTFPLLSPLGTNRVEATPTPKTRVYDQYSFSVIAKKEFPKGEITLEGMVKQEVDFTSWVFSYQYQGKKISGMLNLPNEAAQFIGKNRKIIKTDKKWPVVVMMRGYVDENIYYTGIGTQPAASVFAKSGLITFAPDFLGFGSSNEASSDILEARFQCPEEVMALLSSLETFTLADSEKMFFWAHSNGGQITMSVLEITGKKIPTTFWAPVSKGFPEAVLYYMDLDNLDEGGQKVKKAIDEFLLDYDPADFSVDYHFDQLKSPMQVHQGGADEWVPTDWSDNFVQKVRDVGGDIKYYKYPKADHNLRPDWDQVVERDLEFFRKYFQ